MCNCIDEKRCVCIKPSKRITHRGMPSPAFGNDLIKAVKQAARMQMSETSYSFVFKDEK